MLAKTIPETEKQLSSLREQDGTLGFIPTMGALHEGHVSLIRCSAEDNRFTAVSIFVNPTQFNEQHDFNLYPRNLEEDLKILSTLPVDLVFAPSVAEVYPEPDNRVFEFGDLDKTMEGLHRPGHFNGVAQVVSRLLEIIRPERAYFGEKDFQQLAIVRALVQQLAIPVEIIGCPVFREADGLAMSSRNQLLTPEERSAAAGIPRALLRAQELAGKLTVDKLEEEVIQQLNRDPRVKVEYFRIVGRADLQPVRHWSDPGAKIGCVAVKIGRIRLIDNVNISS